MHITKSNLLLAASAVALAVGAAACSSDDNTPSNVNTDNAIRFAANTEFARSGDITTNNLKAFNVYAFTGTSTTPNVFMDNVEVTKTSGSTWTYSPLKYWPANETVDFYAYAPSTWVGSNSPLRPVPYETAYGDEDIIYAVSPDMSGVAGTANAQVIFNFRHALSKVTVKMSSTNTHLRVQVSNVALSHLHARGNFNFPKESTADPTSATTVGSWSDQNTPIPYLLHMSQRADEVINLTSTPTDMGTATTPGSRYLIPQPLVWASNGQNEDTYIAVMCSVYDAETGDKLWPNANTPAENVVEGSTFGDGLLKFPLSTSSFHDWKPGYHYIYNLIINSNEDMGAIEFGTPNVDTFVDVETTYQ